METPWIVTLVDSIARSPHPRAEPSVAPETPPGGSRDMGSGHSIPIGEPEVGPPRSGFVLRLCIRKADEAWGEAALGHGLADTRFSNPRILGALAARIANARRFRACAEINFTISCCVSA